MRGGVTNNERSVKIELLSQWKLEAELRNVNIAASIEYKRLSMGAHSLRESESKSENKENTFFSLKLQSLCCSPIFGCRVTTIVVRPPELFELPPGEALLIVLLEYSEEAFDSIVELDFTTFVCLDTV